MFCPNCGTQLGNGVNFCPNCGTKVVAVTPMAINPTAAQGNMVMLLSLGACARATAAVLLQQLCGYGTDEALIIVDSAPITVARGLTDAQARYLAQAFAEYGMEVSVYDGNGWRDWESGNTSVWDQAGGMLTAVAAALGLISVDNRITRDMMHRMDYPYRFAGNRPPVYRLNSTLRTTPRRVAPVRPPVHRAAAPVRPAPVRPAPPVRPVAPQPVRPATPPRPAGPVAPQPVRPAAPQRPTGPAARPAGPTARPTGPAARPAGPAARPASPAARPTGPDSVPGAGRPGGGVGRQGGPGRTGGR